MGKRRPSAAFLEAGKAWRTHLDDYRKAHPNMSLKQQMKGAKKTYKKTDINAPLSSVQVRSKPNRTKRKVKRTKRRTGKKKRGLFNLF